MKYREKTLTSDDYKYFYPFVIWKEYNLNWNEISVYLNYSEH